MSGADRRLSTVNLAPADLVEIEGVRAGVDAHLEAHVLALRPVLRALSPDAGELADAIAQMLSGGKRLRAAFCYWSWRAHGGSADSPAADSVLRVGAALELFQAAALFHDDVMDRSDTRRGLPAAQLVFAAMHLRNGWTGDGARFGDSAAILLGDLALIASEQVFAEAVTGFDAETAGGALRVFNHMRTEVTAGQYLDVLAQVQPWGTDPTADEERARAVIRAKSARYSVEHPLTLGAALAGATEESRRACTDIGLPLGEAFQLRDDILGVFGDPARTGKPAGDDLREGKRTVLVARAMAHAARVGDERTAAMLRDDLGDRAMTEPRAREIAGAIAATGAVGEVEELIDTLTQGAHRALDAADLLPEGRRMLRSLAHAAVDRQA
ncbi:octaprenyl-diphosphate synthase [mine drainage metagenome]|uniref:Octaprenyl-diphosphate synthase n=1 Tax=mine drainage metagenome TaxID=410659 RepID=A0A1J5RXG9_9ZZZZ